MTHPQPYTGAYSAATPARAKARGDQPLLSISVPAVQENFLTLTERMSAKQTFCAAVVKADCYGLGAETLAPALWQVGARVFFTAHLGEALELRKTLPEAAIYVLSGLRRADIPLFAHYRLVPVLNRLEEVELWLGHAGARGQKVPAALHIDTGMGRLGLDEQELSKLKDRAELLKAFSPLLYMSHLANAEIKAHEGNLVQLASFNAALAGLPVGQRSMINSAGCFLPDDYAFELARPGAALYGINPTPDVTNPMQPVVGLSAPILQVRTLQMGDTVGYGSTWAAPQESRIATISLGYADGISRALNQGVVYVAGTPCPVVGRISMDLMTVDVTHLRADQTFPGTQVEIIGPNQTVDELAKASGTIGYEILTSLGSRFARTYLGR